MQPIYRNIENWIVLETTTIHDFGEPPQPITVVNVLIGTLHHGDGERRTPITRWMTLAQLNKYRDR